MTMPPSTMLWPLPGLLLILPLPCHTHPQCLDFTAPMPDQGLDFCSQYSSLSCCKTVEEAQIRYDYQRIYGYLRNRDNWESCQTYVKDLLCQKCSPYAAHIYEAEGTTTPRVFPGLSESYCYDYYNKCSDLTSIIAGTSNTKLNMTSAESFCSSALLSDLDYGYPSLLTNPLLNHNLTRLPTIKPTEGCLCLAPVQDRLASPLWAGHAQDGSGRLFIATQQGKVFIYNTKNTSLMKQLFLDLSIATIGGSYVGDERGFLGIAFHPEFTKNGRLFIFYTTSRDRNEPTPENFKTRSYFKTRISEMRVSLNNSDKVDETFEKVVLELPQPYNNHNGGELFFGIDGYLYVFTGDGGAAGDPLDAGQDKTVLYGKALRLDVDSDPSQPYSIPPDNPFVNEINSRPEIYAYGLRNVWRCGLDKGDKTTGEGRGRILCGDVGQDKYEEINLLQKGGNYGWNAREGFECFDEDKCGAIGPEVLPIVAYNHTLGKSVTGGVFYRGCNNPALSGMYIYGDYMSSRLWSLKEGDGGRWVNKELNLCGPTVCDGGFVGSLNDYILSFGEDEDGEIYVLTSKSSSATKSDGVVYRIVDPATRGGGNTIFGGDVSSCANNVHVATTRLPFSGHFTFLVSVLFFLIFLPCFCLSCITLIDEYRPLKRRRQKIKFISL